MYDGFKRIDLHGKNSYQARIILDSEIRKAQRGVYQIHVVHGQTYGTELKDMIREVYSEHPKVIRVIPGSNGGETILVLRELYCS